MKNILLPTDFSENSINAINYALRLYEYELCHFYVINVIKVSSIITDDLMAMQPSQTIYNSLIASSKSQVKKLIKNLKSKYSNVMHTFHAVVDYDNFIDAINQVVKEKRIDLIVMGTKGASNVEKILFGTNTVHVMQRGNCPVLSIPSNYKFKPLRKIAFTSNYSTHYNANDLEPLISLAENNNYMIDILHMKVYDHLTESEENNRAFLDVYLSNVEHAFISLENNNLFKTIENYVDKNKIGLLAMMSRKHSFLERLFTTHAVESFAFKINIPFLVMENTGGLYKK
ncbi:hypothetical protein A9Q87_13135 [Flavobacteriales bacterium 34_180_T64]|nr:hypothetical protein A9Q87_13135 [Flavobacteriales bacterium 34_180_T64]